MVGRDTTRRDSARAEDRTRARTQNADHSVLWVNHDNNRSHDRHGHEPAYDRVSSDRKRVVTSSRSRSLDQENVQEVISVETVS